jgi:RimJ/RimL family protein N-acetyltransferase
VSIRAVFLTGERAYLRAHLASDKEHAAAWHASPFPIDAARAEDLLKDAHKELVPDTKLFAICRVATDEIVGGARAWTSPRHADLSFHMAAWLDDADELRAEALGLLVRWLRDEVEMLTVTAALAADQPATIAAAEALGMLLGVRLREHIARPGRRVDLLNYQALNPRWRIAEEGAGNA